MLTVQRSLIKFGKELGLCALMLSVASGVCSAASSAAVTGVVRDARGVAQMGAMVQVLAVSSATVATAFTDFYGRYRIADLTPGKYQVRATAVLFVPSTRKSLQLSTGMRATVDLTLNMLSDPSAWLPATERRPDEPGDDWTWTLRSAANRPILRMLDDGRVELVSAGPETRSHGAPMRTHVSVSSGSGAFGEGGVRDAVAFERTVSDGSDVVVRAETATLHDGGDVASEVDAGYGRNGMFGNASRMIVSYASHPELSGSGQIAGMQMVRMASAQRMRLGDAVDVEAGGTVYAIHMGGNAAMARPFLHVTVHPGQVWAVEYKLETARNRQGFDGLDSIRADLPVAAMHGVRLRTENGRHQEIAASRKIGNGQIRAAVYRDVIDQAVVSGSGVLSAADMVSSATDGVVADSATGSFRLLRAGYATNGVAVNVSEPLTSSLWAALECASGAALSAKSGTEQGLTGTNLGLHPDAGQVVAAGLTERVQRTGTTVRVGYRWQPQRMVTAVAPYGGLGDQPYLSLYLRQAVRWGDKLPAGLEATVDVTNLLAEGYHPFVSVDGRTLYLAQSPQILQAGLSFTF